MRRESDCCPDDARTFACWTCLGSECTCGELPEADDGPEHDADEGWARAQDAEIYRDW